MGKYTKYATGAYRTSPLWEFAEKDADSFAWLRAVLQQAAPLFDLAEGVALVPDNQLLPGNNLARGVKVPIVNAANSLFGVLDAVKSPEEAQEKQKQIRNALEVLQQGRPGAQQWAYVPLIYRLEADLGRAHTFLDLMDSLSARLEGLDSRLTSVASVFAEHSAGAIQQVQQAAAAARESLETAATQTGESVERHLKETSAKFEETLAQAGLYKEKAKEQFEEAAAYFQNEAMTAFGAAFHTEGILAQEKADNAGYKAFAAFVLLLAALGFFALADMQGWIDLPDTAQVLRWSLLRLSAVAFLAWFIGHYFRERKNFLHVAVANRHRRNLCNAYIAVSQKMTDVARDQYLSHILPELSVLGKTGFITKEEIPETPSGDMLRSCVDFLKGKVSGT